MGGILPLKSFAFLLFLEWRGRGADALQEYVVGHVPPVLPVFARIKDSFFIQSNERMTIMQGSQPNMPALLAFMLPIMQCYSFHVCSALHHIGHVASTARGAIPCTIPRLEDSPATPCARRVVRRKALNPFDSILCCAPRTVSAKCLLRLRGGRKVRMTRIYKRMGTDNILDPVPVWLGCIRHLSNLVSARTCPARILDDAPFPPAPRASSTPVAAEQA
jgi:hypothetical protein